MTKSLTMIPLSQLAISEFNARSASVEDFQAPDFIALKESIKENGLLQPLVTSKDASGYTVIAGRRRLLALQMIHERDKKDQDIPCLLVDGAEAVEQTVLSLEENDKRTPLTPQEWKVVYLRLHDMGLNDGKIASMCHRSKAWVTAIKSGKPWSQLHAEQREKARGSEVQDTEKRETFECPSCGVKLLRVQNADGVEYNIPNQDNTADEQPMKRGKKK